jgi:uncharacterized protein (DUF2062 family)
MSEPEQRESLWRRWVIKPIVSQLSQGTEPTKIAWAIAFGITTGVFPLLGMTIIVSLAVSLPLKLNQPILQVFRELMYPVHLASILGFIHAGERLCGVPHTSLSIKVMLERFSASPSQFMADYGMLGVYAVSVWALIAPVLLMVVYFTALPLVTRLARRFSRSAYAR